MAKVEVWRVRYFQTNRGKFPVKDFIEEQDLTQRAKIGKSIRLLINYGPFLKPPESKKLQKSLYELRIKGRIQIRIFYTMLLGEYYLLHAFKKKSQKTSAKEIKIAIDRIKDLI